jgi:hypothetical protein
MIELRIYEGAFRCQKADYQRIEEISISDFKCVAIAVIPAFIRSKKKQCFSLVMEKGGLWEIFSCLTTLC